MSLYLLLHLILQHIQLSFHLQKQQLNQILQLLIKIRAVDDCSATNGNAAAILKEKCKVADVPGYVRMITPEREEADADSDDEDAADSDNDFGLDNDVDVGDIE